MNRVADGQRLGEHHVPSRKWFRSRPVWIAAAIVLTILAAAVIARTAPFPWVWRE